MSHPMPYDFGVKMRGSSGFQRRDFARATVGFRQSYGMPMNFPVFDLTPRRVPRPFEPLGSEIRSLHQNRSESPSFGSTYVWDFVGYPPNGGRMPLRGRV